MSVRTAEYERIKSILLADKINTPSRLSDAVRSDIIAVLSAYMELDPLSFLLEIEPTDGGFKIRAEGEAARLKG